MFKERKVDVYTTSVEVSERFIELLPGRITGEMFHIDESEPGIKQYCFLNLPYTSTIQFLKARPGACEVRDSETGEFIYPSEAYKRNSLSSNSKT